MFAIKIILAWGSGSYPVHGGSKNTGLASSQESWWAVDKIMTPFILRPRDLPEHISLCRLSVIAPLKIECNKCCDVNVEDNPGCGLVAVDINPLDFRPS